MQWKDGLTDWVAMKDIRDSHPLELSECEISSDIQHDIEFYLWVSFMVKKWGRIWREVKPNYRLITHNYMIQGHKFILEVKQINGNNNNTFWMYAIQINMKDIMVAFK